MQYRQLLLRSGGGIIANDRKSPQSNCVNIAIGLGGAGIACLRNLKRQVYTYLQPDDPGAEVPAYRHIRFLAVDIDRYSLDPDGQIYDLNEATEYFDIASSNIQGLLQQTTVLAGKPECKWLKNKDDEKGQGGLSILSATVNAYGIRQIGRLLIIQRSHTFVDRIIQLVEGATADLPENCLINIHIFTGLCGGTGSGIFLDVCYMIQHALTTLGLRENAVTCGYFFLPDVNLSKPAIAANPNASDYLRVNAFAAMKELDHCMSFHSNHDCWDQDYRNFHIGPTQEPPVQLCHLVSAADLSGNAQPDGFDRAMQETAAYVMQFCTGHGPDNTPHNISWLAATMANTVPRTDDANYRYCAIGVTEARIPLAQINAYLSSKLFARMVKTQDRMPSREEIRKFADDNGLRFCSLLRSLLDKTTYQMPALQLDRKLYTAMPEEDPAPPDEVRLPESIAAPYRETEQQMVQQVQTNKQALLREWKRENSNSEYDNVSRMCKVYYALSDVISDPDKGPGYAASLLKGLGDTLKDVLKEAQATLIEADGDVTLRSDAVKRARSAFLHPGLTLKPRGRLFNDFLCAVQQYMTARCKRRVLTELEDMLRLMIGQMEKLYETHFKLYARVFENLLDTFRENDRYLTDSAQDPYVIPLVTIGDLKESMDKTVATIRPESELQAFHSMLFGDPQVWITGDENKITKRVSTYLTDKFSGYTSKTLTDYLALRFGTSDPAQLAALTYEQILIPLIQRTNPLFRASPDFCVSDLCHTVYLSLPENNACITDAGVMLTGTESAVQLVHGTDPLCIRVTRAAGGIPLFGYSETDSCRKIYHCDVSVGKHLYEETSRDPRDWRLLPDLLPPGTSTGRSPS